ncbi:MAG: LamG domain-containing protein, partial [Candidatus Aminicenantes bacterium]|nr:LamG domain-containing protein [Candidatus Aminicenantes bacterium]
MSPQPRGVRPRFVVLSAAAVFSILSMTQGPIGGGMTGPRTPSDLIPARPAEGATLLAWWPFDDERPPDPSGGVAAGRGPGAVAAKARDAVSGLSDLITGNFRPVRGISGAGLKLDGYTTSIRRAGSGAPRLDGAFSLEAWIALAAYPWNFCPIAAQKRGDAGFAFSAGPRGELSFSASDEGEWLNSISGPVLPLRTWVHVAAVYDPGAGIRVYADGRLVGSVARPSRFKPASGADIVLGSVTEPVRPSHAVGGGEGTLPSWFSLDAIL